MLKPLTVVHVDNDIKQVEEVRAICSEVSEFNLLASFTSAAQALDFILDNSPDIALLDIEMPEKDGIWLADQIKNSDTAIVFLTSYPDYALRAFDVLAIHYLIKPLTPSMLVEAAGRCRTRAAKQKTPSSAEVLQSDQIQELQHNLQHKGWPSKIFIHNLHKSFLLKTEDIMYFISKGSYTNIKGKDGDSFVASKPLKLYTDTFSGHPDFVRLHKSNFVNKQFVKAVVRDKHNISIKMLDDAELEVSPIYRKTIFELLGG